VPPTTGPTPKFQLYVVVEVTLDEASVNVIEFGPHIAVSDMVKSATGCAPTAKAAQREYIRKQKRSSLFIYLNGLE
jgi:hypothetical protein